MRILFVTHDNKMTGGANRSMLQLMMELRHSYDIQPIVLLPLSKPIIGDDGLENECKKNDIFVIKTIVPWFKHHKIWVHRFKYLGMWILFPILVNQLRRMRIDIVHTNGSIIDIGSFIARSLKVPHVWHLREFGTEDEATKQVWGEAYSRNAYAYGDIFIAISEAIRKSFSSVIPDCKLVKIYNGISIEKYKNISLHKNSKIQFVVVGQVVPHKNQEEAVRAIKILKEKGYNNFHLNVIGSPNSSYLKSMEAFIEINNLKEYITFWGFRNDVSSILTQMDVGLMLSKSEAFGRVTIEYMFQNLAVIATNTGANPELIKDGETGFLYAYGNTHELANKMATFLNDFVLLETMSHKARTKAIERFSSSQNTKSIYEVYKSLLKS